LNNGIKNELTLDNTPSIGNASTVLFEKRSETGSRRTRISLKDCKIKGYIEKKSPQNYLQIQFKISNYYGAGTERRTAATRINRDKTIIGQIFTDSCDFV
jgi:hypothetical protein